MESGERATDSSSVILFTTLDGVVIRSLVVSSLIIDRSVGRVEWVEVPMSVRRMDLSATFGFLTNMRRRSFAVFETAGVPGVPHKVSDHLA